MNRSCVQCSSPINDTDYSCGVCGGINALPGGERIECENHPTEPAVAVCVLCGKPVCGDCATSVQEKSFCDDKNHQSVFADWSVVFEGRSGFEADMMVRNLEQAGLEVRSFDRQLHAAVIWLDVRPRVDVRVRKNKAADAMEVLRSLQLLDEIHKSGG